MTVYYKYDRVTTMAEGKPGPPRARTRSPLPLPLPPSEGEGYAPPKGGYPPPEREAEKRQKRVRAPSEDLGLVVRKTSPPDYHLG